MTFSRFGETTFDALRARMRAARDCGDFHVELRDRSEVGGGADARAAGDALAVALGFRAMGRGWHALDRAQARQVIGGILHRDLAYHHPIMDQAAADALADAFLAHFGRDAAFFTNAAFEHHPVFLGQNGWSTFDPLTGGTFDTGVVAVDARHVGLVWAADED